MKKTLTVNLNGRVFNIDEDAYFLLDKYLHNLRIYFRKEEGYAEILADFEARIEELLGNRIRLGYNVISIEDVEKVIAQMGRPGDFGEEETSVEDSETQRNAEPTKKRKFYRNNDDKMLAGVCSGIASYFDWNTLAVRIIFIILILATTLSFGLVYLVLWMILPEARTAEEKLEMQGKPITVENIGKTVAAETETPSRRQNDGCLGAIVDFIVAFFKVGFVCFGCLVGIPLLFALIIVVIVLFATLFGVGSGLLVGFGPWLSGASPLILAHPTLATISFCFIIGIPLFSLLYAIISYLFKLKSVHVGVKWAGIISWIVALILFFSSGFKINENGFNSSWNWKNASWSWSTSNSSEIIIGDGILADRIESMPPIQYLELDANMVANLQIEQIESGETSLLINGDSNLIDKVELKIEDNGSLVLSTINGYSFESNSPIIFHLRTPVLKGVKLKTLATINILGALSVDDFVLKLEGAGSLRADSLYVNELKVKTEGVGSITLAGVAKKASFELEGAGKIDALELLSDSVFAKVDGVGSVKCNPIQYLKGSVNGVGKITYKTAPQNENSEIFGFGKIGLE